VIIRLPANNWQPREYQQDLWNAFEAGKKRLLEVAHRRWGKDEIALNMAAVSAFEHPATYWHMLPEYSQARKAIWNAINPHTNTRRIDEAFPLELRENTNEQEMFIRFKNGATWQVVGSDSYKSLVGAPPYGIVFSEWAKAHPAAWAYLAPILEENGGWAAFITTPEGKNHCYDMYKLAKKHPDWFAEVQTVEDTGFPIERIDAAREQYQALYGIDAGDALIEQEYYCSFDAAILGAIYGKQMSRLTKEGRITDRVKHDPAYPVYTAFDLGRRDATAIWFYQIGLNEILLIDYYEESFLDPQEICEILYGRQIKVNHINPETREVDKWEFGEWIPKHEHRKEYKYHDFHYVPQDAGNKLQAANGRSTVQQCREFGIAMAVIPETTHANRHAALRKTLDRCWFNEERCDKGIEALRCYHLEYNEETKTFGKEPAHDWSSHGSTAAELMARVWTEKVVTSKEVERNQITRKFHSLREKHGLTRDEDPYQSRKRRKK
jgi:phage terminase large subunit